MIREAIIRIVEGEDLEEAEAATAMAEIMEGTATPAQIAGFLVALRMKGETVEELTGMARTMLERAVRLQPRISGPLVDMCGTGAAPHKTFNISTIASFVVAGAGVAVAKHGNRSVTSACGSADLVERLGVRLDLPPEQVSGVLERCGIAFLFAPLFHPAMKQAAGPRKELGLRSAFNLLGPLTNPAGASAQLLGVYGPEWVPLLPEVLGRLGRERALVVHGQLGTDELSTVGLTDVGELRDGEVTTWTFDPADLGIELEDSAPLRARPPEESVALAVEILSGKTGPETDAVLLNAAAGLYVGGKAPTIGKAYDLAEESLRSGAALAKARALVEATGGTPGPLGGR